MRGYQNRLPQYRSFVGFPDNKDPSKVPLTSETPICRLLSCLFVAEIENSFLYMGLSVVPGWEACVVCGDRKAAENLMQKMTCLGRRRLALR